MIIKGAEERKRTSLGIRWVLNVHLSCAVTACVSRTHPGTIVVVTEVVACFFDIYVI